MTITYGLPQESDLEGMVAVESTCFSDAEQFSADEIKLNFINYYKLWMVAKNQAGEVVGNLIMKPVDHPRLNNDDYHSVSENDDRAKYMAILSLAVLPDYQGKGIAGQLLRRALILTKLTGRIAIVLDCKDELIPYYEAHRFQRNGDSDSTFANVHWNAMVHPI